MGWRESSSLLLLCNGTNGGLVFTDSSPTPKTVTNPNSACQTVETGAKFGTSLKVVTTNGCLSLPAGVFNFGTADFTIDFWVKLSTPNTQYPYVLSSGRDSQADGGFYMYADGTGTSYGGTGVLRFASCPGAAYPILLATTGVNMRGATEYSHIAVTRSGFVTRLFHNGVLKQSQTAAGANNYTDNASYNRVMGSPVSSGYCEYNGFLDDLRVIKGMALWTDNFTPPTKQIELRAIDEYQHSGVYVGRGPSRVNQNSLINRQGL